MKFKVLAAALTLSCSAFSQNVLTPEKLLEFKRLSGATVSPDGTLLLFSQTTMDVANNKGNADLFVVNLKDNSIKQLTNTPYSEYDAQWGGKNTIYFMTAESGRGDIYKMNFDGTNKQKISDVDNINGFKIAPNEQSILILHDVKTKNTIQETYPDLPKSNARVEDDLLYRHWASWDDYQVEHLFHYKIEAEKMVKNGVDLMKGEPFASNLPPFGGMGNITISHDSKFVVFATKKSKGKEFALSTNSELYKVNLQTLEQSCITCDKNFKGYDNHPAFSSKGDLAWLSMARDGFEADKNDLIVLSADGKITNFTAKHDLTINDFVWNTDGTKLFALVPTKGTVQIYEIVIATGAVNPLTSGRHDYISLTTHGSNIYAGRQSMLSPVEYFGLEIVTSKKTTKVNVKQLTNANTEMLKQLDQPTVQERWVETSDGKKMLTWIMLPPNFDETKKYPTLLYCQGGPQSQVSQFFSYRWNLMLMASQGYIIVAPNRRGLPGFGQEWNDAISKDWGGQPIKDYLAAIDDASTLPYVDKDRLGAIGASYGGYSVYMLAGVHENRFKTFVSHCGLFNLESWYGMTEELFFAKWDIGGPYWEEENKEAFLKNSPHRYVKNWNTPILVIHGGIDFRVPEAEGMQAYQVAQLKGIKSRFLHFPTEGHWVLTPQNGLVWHREFFRWLAEDLKP